MANVFITIEDETVLSKFHRALTQAGSIGSDMIQVRTKIEDGIILKIVRTECPWAIAVFREITKGSAS